MWQTFTGTDHSMTPVSGHSGGGGAGVSAPGGWHPTIMYLVILLAVEIFAVGLLSRTVLR